MGLHRRSQTALFPCDQRESTTRLIAKLESSGADGVILGCTEIVLLVKPADTNIELFDTTAIHARKIVNAALSREID